MSISFRPPGSMLLGLAMVSGACDLEAPDGRARALVGATDTDAASESDGETGAVEDTEAQAPIVADNGCTRTRGYWQTHNREGVAKTYPWPIPEDSELCGRTWLDVLHTSPKGDAWTILAAQWIAASLNVASGAPVSPEIGAALERGRAILESCEVTDREDALSLKTLLDRYNNGLEGVEHCDRSGGEEGGGETSGGDDTAGDDTDGGGDTDGSTSDTGQDSSETTESGGTGSSTGADTGCVVDPEGVVTCDTGTFPPVG